MKGRQFRSLFFKDTWKRGGAEKYNWLRYGVRLSAGLAVFYKEIEMLSDTEQWEHDEQRMMEQEIEKLREKNQNLFNALMAATGKNDELHKQMSTRKLTHAEWVAEATAKFGEDATKWLFVCPSCGHVASVQDWKDVGAKEGEVAFSCIGRHAADHKAAAANAFRKSGGPCNYAGGGLFAINPVQVDFEGEVVAVFEFAEAPHAA